jgi:osmotically-inducible protein OsmY
MRFKLAVLTISVVMALFLSGCAEETNLNTNTNSANANAAAANANANVNANANTATRRGPTREEYEREKNRYSREAKEAGRTIGTGLNDGWLWVKTRFELAAADDLRDSTINVDVDKGVVTLTGTVATAAQKSRAEAIVKPIEGVTSVKNVLKVSATGNTNAPKK